MKNKAIKILIADDHEVFRDGLKLLLNKDEDIKVVGEASNGKRLIELAKQHLPDVIITDLVMEEMGGIEAIKAIVELKIPVKIIAISTFNTEQIIVEALEAGAIGYILKNAQRGEIVEAVKTVYDNHPYYCKSTSSLLIKLISKSRFNPYPKGEAVVFSEKEIQIIRLICIEKTSEEIGKMLFMGKRNVDAFRIRISQKMNVKTTAGIAIYAIKNGIFSLDE